MKREHWYIAAAVVGAVVIGYVLLTRRAQGESGAVTFQTIAPSEATSQAAIAAGVSYAGIAAQERVSLAQIFTEGEVSMAGIGAGERTRARELATEQAISGSLFDLEKYRISASERVATRELENQKQRGFFDFVVDIFSSIGSVFGGKK